MNKLHF